MCYIRLSLSVARESSADRSVGRLAAVSRPRRNAMDDEKKKLYVNGGGGGGANGHATPPM